MVLAVTFKEIHAWQEQARWLPCDRALRHWYFSASANYLISRCNCSICQRTPFAFWAACTVRLYPLGHKSSSLLVMNQSMPPFVATSVNSLTLKGTFFSLTAMPVLSRSGVQSMPSKWAKPSSLRADQAVFFQRNIPKEHK